MEAFAHNIDIDRLPEAAQRELITFYEFLVFKYTGRSTILQSQKQEILTAIFQEAAGKLPSHYTFNRDEIHER